MGKSFLILCTLWFTFFACGGCGGSTPHKFPADVEIEPLIFQSAPTETGDGTVSADGSHLALPPVPETATGLNVLLILTEDHGPHTGAYGTPGLKTPNMDRLARRGARYTRAYVTVSACSPSKSAMSTGLYNQVTGAIGNVNEFFGNYERLKAENPRWFSNPSSPYNKMSIKTKEPTFVEILKHADYFTGLCNKFHRSPHSRYPYDFWQQVKAGGASHEEVLTNFIDAAKMSGKPWFLEYNIGVTHRPWRTPKENDFDLSAIEPPRHLPDTETVRQDWASYLKSIQSADKIVGQVLDALEDRGELENTIIILIGDNGPEYHRGKFSIYNFGLHVAFFISGSGISGDTVRSDLFSSVDLLPTLLDFLGLKTVGRIDGVSHYSILTGAGNKAPRNYLVGLRGTDRSITDGRFHLLFMPNPEDTLLGADLTDMDPWNNPVYQHILENKNTPGFEAAYRFLDLADHNLKAYTRPRFELYDLSKDPWEIRDLAQDPEYSDALNNLKNMLRQWMDGYNDDSERP